MRQRINKFTEKIDLKMIFAPSTIAAVLCLFESLLQFYATSVSDFFIFFKKILPQVICDSGFSRLLALSLGQSLRLGK